MRKRIISIVLAVAMILCLVPFGVMAADDEIAATAVSICRLSGIDIPNDIAVIGVDDNESLCENTVPTLSSVRPDFQQGGRFAARLLARMMRARISALVSGF